MAIGFALLGAGIFATREHLPAIEATPELALKAIYSRSQKTAETLQAKAAGGDAVAVYFDEPAVAGRGLADLLARDDIAAVSVCLPIGLQLAIVQRALAAGKHVISEKPVAPTVAEARAAIEAYEALPQPDGVPRLIWAVAENYRYQPSLLAAEAAGRQLGGPLVAFSLRSSRLVRDADVGYIATPWRRTPTYPGGFLLDGGVHFVAALRKLLLAAANGHADGSSSAISSVSCFSAQLQPHLPPVDTLRAIAVTNGNVSGTIDLSFGVEFGGPPLEVAVATTEGRLVWTPQRVTVQRRDVPETLIFDANDPAVVPPSQFNGVKAEFAAFARNIATGATVVEPAQSPREALQDLVVLEAMLLSGENGEMRSCQ